MRDYIKAALEMEKPTGACLAEERIVAFYGGQLTASEEAEVRDHLATCPACLEMAREARQFLQAMSGPPQAHIGPPRRLPAPWHQVYRPELFWLAASVLIALSIILWRGWRVEAPSPDVAGPSAPAPRTPPSSPENPWRHLEIAKAEYTPPAQTPDDLIWRDEGGPSAPSKLTPFARAMRSYERGEYALAERQLERFLETDPTHAEALFYRGVSLLLIGRTADAIAPLQAATRHGPGRVREDAHWYLALAYLKAGGPPQALEHLNWVVQASGRHHSEARQLQQEIQSVIGGQSTPSPRPLPRR
jgi:tetratricopeptide (TPR) repeat protein